MAVDFDGVDDGYEYSVPNFGNVTSTGFTLSAWIEWDGVSGGDNDRIIDVYPSDGSFGFQVQIISSGGIQFAIGYSSTILVRIGSDEPTIGSPTHLAVTYPGGTTASNVRIYLDATNPASYTTTTNGSGTYTHASERVCVGKRRNSATGNQEFDGRVWDLAIWSANLDGGGNITALSKGVSPLLMQPEDLAAYFPYGGSVNELLSGAVPTEYGNPALAETPRSVSIGPQWTPANFTPSAAAPAANALISKLSLLGVGI